MPFALMETTQNNHRPGPGVQGGANDKETGAEGWMGYATKRAPDAIVAANLGANTRGSEWQGE